MKLPENEIVRLYTEEKKIVTEIAKKYNYSSATIYRILKKHNVKSNRKLNLPEKDIINMYINGKNTVEIGNIFNCSNILINKILKKHGVEVTRKINLPEDTIINMYLKEEKSAKEISKLFNCGRTLIGNILKKHNIIIRDSSYYCYGKNNPNWCGGQSIKYCSKYNNDCRLSCHEKWFYTCVLCGHKSTPNTRAHSTHHIDYNKEAGCDGSSLKIIELCCSCHAKTNGNDGNRKKYQNILSHIYLLREMIDNDICFDYRSVSDLGSLSIAKGE